jgi:sigma-B regulation protein RsbU (phosphoserine phosphatase)
MHNIEGQGDDELVKLLLKRQSELNALLELTQAINKNSSRTVLLQMLQSILKSYMQVGKLRFLVEKDGTFCCISRFGGKFETDPVLYRSCMLLKKIKSPTSLTGYTDALLNTYNYFIPIYHKSKPLAYALIGGFEREQQVLGNDLSFIQTLINVIVVALENKKLFKERLQAERFQREIELAVEVQNMLVPVKLHKDKAVEVSAKYIPHQDIGGDYFDFLRLNDHEFLWCIADVSGKGIAAALLMANFQASLRAWATVENDLATVVKQLNSIVVNNTRGERFITLFIAKYNEHNRKLCYVNAGHNPPILRSGGQFSTLEGGCPMIGVFDDLPFLKVGEVQVEPGSMVFNYTDGLMDYELQQGTHWDEDKLMAFVMENGHLPSDDFNQTLMDHLGRVVKSNRIDDITILTLNIF